MGQFWDAATAQAGREFGARHYRWFAAARVTRRLAPGIVVLIGLAALAGSIYAGYQWLDPDWAATGNWFSETGSRFGVWANDLGSVLLWVLAAAVALAGVVVAIVTVRRNWWRLSLSLPMWMRRY